MPKTPLAYRIAYKLPTRGIYEPLIKLVEEMGAIGVGVDIGSGYGLAAEQVASYFEKLFLVEIDVEMAEDADKRLEEAPNIEIIIADARKLPFPDSFADLVYFFDSLHHIPRLEEALLEAIRITKQGGMLAIFDLDGNHPFAKFISRIERMLGLHSRPMGLNRLCGILEERSFSIISAKVNAFGMVDLLALKGRPYRNKACKECGKEFSLRHSGFHKKQFDRAFQAEFN